jgi:large subunit ribosomal protein L44e
MLATFPLYVHSTAQPLGIKPPALLTIGLSSTQEHKVSQYKTGAARLLAQGKRRYDRKMRGFGGQKKPIFHKKAKITKKISIKLQCTECKTMAQRCLGRTKSFTLGAPSSKAKKGEALNY